METPVFSALVFAAFGLMVLLTGGIIYLTVAEWRDRRLRDQDSRETRISRRSVSKR